MKTENYKIEVLPLFEEDLNQAANYIKNVLKNNSAANRLVDNVAEAILERSKNPLSFAPYPFSYKFKNTYYRIYVGNYTIYYIVKDDVMEIHRLLFSSSDIDRQLE